MPCRLVYIYIYIMQLSERCCCVLNGINKIRDNMPLILTSVYAVTKLSMITYYSKLLNYIDNNNMVFIITSICCDIKLSPITSDYKWTLSVPFSPIQHRPTRHF